MSLSGAIANLQAKALALTTAKIKATPETPQDSVPPLPASVTAVSSGTCIFVTASQTRIDCTVDVEFYFPRGNLPEAYRNINNALIEYLKAVAGDPTLGGNVTNVVNPTFNVNPNGIWDAQQCVLLVISCPLKILETPA